MLRAKHILAGSLILFCSFPVLAEKADRNKPVNLEADTVTVDDVTQTSVYLGNVILTQGTLVIRGDKLIVKEGAEGFEHGTVFGRPATFKQKREGYDEYIEGFAERIEYDAKGDKAQLFDHASMKRKQDEVRGNYISYDAKTEFYQVLGGAKETGAAGGRVRAVIQPKPKPGADTSPGIPSASTKPASDAASPSKQ